MEDYLIEFIGAAIGGVMAIVFEFAPKIKTWYAALSRGQKQLVIGVMGLVVSVAMFALNCAGILSRLFPDIVITCDFSGGWMMVRVLIAVVGAAQTVHVFVNKPIRFVLGK